MKKHIYYRIILRLVSPLSIGNGKNEFSDHDCIRRNDSTPYIPASSIAGVFRHYFDGNQELQENIFGKLHNYSAKSSIIFYDAEPLDKIVFSIRDSVQLKDKVGIDGAKFNMEVVETGAEFITYMEIDGYNYDKQQYIEELFSALRNDILRFGTKISRGYGIVEITSLKKAEFELDNSEQLEKWLEFDMFEQSVWDNFREYDFKKFATKHFSIHLELRQASPVSIRVYTTECSTTARSTPDYKHITLNNGLPVIPGTSWAGAFRERFSLFAGEESTEKLFGYIKQVEKDNKKTNITQPSRIRFSESIINNAVPKNITRNSIDRFSAKTKDSALYTEQTYYNGETSLDIIVPDDISEKEKMCIGAVLYDLNNGYLSVGGLTTIGHGMFSVKSISVNNIDKTDCFCPERLPEICR